MQSADQFGVLRSAQDIRQANARPDRSIRPSPPPLRWREHLPGPAQKNFAFFPK